MATPIHPALQATAREGYKAKERSVARQDNPYSDTQAAYYGVSFERAWWAGFDLAAADRIHGDFDGWYRERVLQIEWSRLAERKVPR